MNIKTKRIILYSMYGFICISFLVSALLIKSIISSNKSLTQENNTIKPVNNIVEDKTAKVFEEKDILKKPFDKTDVQIGLSFYDVKSDKKNQEESIINYKNTYMPSTGVLYTSKEKFSITSIYDGKVKEISTSELLGNQIKIDYGNNLIGTYQCISDVTVKVGDDVIVGSVLATSSACNIFPTSNNLYLELVYNGKNINPEYYYGKTLKELK